MTAKRLNRKDLRSDGFVDKTAESIEFLQEHYIKIAIGVLAIVAIYIGITIYGNSSEAARHESADLLFQGQTQIARGNYPGAIQRLEECIDRFGGSDSARLARVDLGQALMATGNNTGALATFEAAIAEAGSDQEFNNELQRLKAVALSNLNRHEEASAVLRTQFDLLPPGALKLSLGMRLSESLKAAGDLPGAIFALEELQTAIDKGEISNPAGDVEKRLTVLRALSH